MSEETKCNNKSSVFNSGLKTPSISEESLADELNTADEARTSETIMQKVCPFQKDKNEDS